MQELSGSVPAEFPPDYARPRVLRYEAGLRKFNISTSTSIRLEETCKTLGTTPFMTLLAVFRILHYRMTGVPDALIGTLNGNRSREEIEGLIVSASSPFYVGYLTRPCRAFSWIRRYCDGHHDHVLVLTLISQALRILVDDNTTFAGLAQGTREVVTKAFEHADVSFDRVVDSLHPARDLSRNPVVQVIFAVHSFNYDSWDVFPGVETTASDPRPTTRMDLELHIYKRASDNTYEGHLLYNLGLYSEAWAKNFTSAFMDLLNSALAHLGIPVADLVFCDAPQGLRERGLLSPNRTDYPQDMTVVDLFHEMVAEYPSHVAVVDDTGSYTYHQIDAASEGIAELVLEYLPSQVAESTVGIFSQRSALNVAAMYGGQ